MAIAAAEEKDLIFGMLLECTGTHKGQRRQYKEGMNQPLKRTSSDSAPMERISFLPAGDHVFDAFDAIGTESNIRPKCSDA